VGLQKAMRIATNTERQSYPLNFDQDAEEYTNFTTVTETLRSDYDFGHTSDATIIPLKDSPINPPFIRLFKPFDERYSDSQDFNVDSLEKFVEEASTPL